MMVLLNRVICTCCDTGMSMPIFNSFPGRLVDSSRNPSLTPSFEGNLLTQRHKVWSQKLETLRYHRVKTRSLCLTWAWFGTGTWLTDGIKIASTRLALRAVARTNYRA